MKSLWKVVAVIVLSTPPSHAATGGIRIEPGLWELVSSLPDPFGGEPMRQTHRTCVRDREITPDRVNREVKMCRVWNVNIEGPLAKWRMSCDTPAGPMAGTGSLRSTPTAVAGSLELAMTIGSLEIPVTGSFKARRLGACR